MLNFLKNIGKWIHGMGLIKLNLNGQLSVKESADTGVKVIDQFLAYVEVDGIRTPEAMLIEGYLSSEANQTIDDIIDVTKEIRDHLSHVSTLPDIATELKDYKFSDDVAKNNFYHELITTSTLVYSDGKISFLDAIVLVTLVKDFVNLIKGNAN
jgi:hypothetical protein